MKINEYKILLIDDDEDDFVNLRDLFAEIPGGNYKITWKSNYDQGLAALRSNYFDVCLLDYRLGEHSGMEILKEAQKLEHVCPILFLTGQGDFELDVQAMQMGASEFLVKSHLTAPLLERSVRYAMKHALDMEEIKESKAQVIHQDRLASLGLLASSLAHEIGTPLGIIRSRAEIVGKKAASEEIKQDMNTVITQIDRISSLVKSLLNLAREKQSEHAIAVSLDEVIKDVLNLMNHEMVRKNIEFSVSVSPGLLVKAEAGPLSQVLLNILVNSVQAIEERRKKSPGGRDQITMTAQAHPDTVVIVIKDTGCGISEKNLQQVFKPFFTTKDIGAGTGLGLATSYKLVQSWRGSISVESQIDKGAQFTIRLLKALR